MQQKNVTLRKRTQIAQANRVMFIWVACASVVFGITAVGAIFLTQMLLYNEKVIAEKSKTVKVLELDNKNIVELQSAIRVLDTKQSLMDARANTNDKPIQAILDALPSDANSLALGASLQNKLLVIPGLNIITLQVDPVVGVESLSGASNSSMVQPTISNNFISFRFSVDAADDATIRQVLQNLEKSIRTIYITGIKIESQDNSRTMNVEAQAFYEPSVVIKLKDVTVK